MGRNKQNKYILACLALLVLGVLYAQAKSHWWRGHLEIDIWTWYQRATNTHLQENEYFPAATVFFLLPLIFLGREVSYEIYLKAIWGINILILSGLMWWCWRKTKRPENIIVFWGVILAVGPIILFRFELMIIVLLLLGLEFWRKNKPWLAGWFFGWAAAIKIFPIILLPVLIKKQNWKRLILGFAGGGLIWTIIFWTWGGRLEQLAWALKFHSFKPVSVESVWGNLVTGVSLWQTGRPPALLGGYGIWGIKANIKIFNYLWLLPVGGLCLWLGKKIRATANIKTAMLVIIVFLLAAKNLHPQYLLWFILLFPFIGRKSWGKSYWWSYGLILTIGILTQIIYPLFYTELIEGFYKQSKFGWLYGLLVARNLLVMVLGWLIFYEVNQGVKSEAT